MRELVIDLSKVWATLCDVPDKGATGTRAHRWTDAEDWMLWETWERKPRLQITKALHVGYDAAKDRFKMLEKQGGPKGRRPEWME